MPLHSVTGGGGVHKFLDTFSTRKFGDSLSTTRGGTTGIATTTGEPFTRWRQRVLAAFTRLSEKHTQQTAVEELTSVIELQLSENDGTLTTFMNVLLDTSSATQKSVLCKEAIRLLAITASHHRNTLISWLPKMVTALVRRLKDTSLPSGTRDIACEAFGMIARYITPVLKSDGNALAVYFRPLLGLLNDQDKGVQTGGAMAIAEVIGNSRIGIVITFDASLTLLEDVVLSDMDRISSRLLERLNHSNTKSHAPLLLALSKLVEVVGEHIYPHVPSYIEAMLNGLTKSDWMTRKAAADALFVFAIRLGPAMGPFKNEIVDVLENCRHDKVPPVRDAVLNALRAYLELQDSPGEIPALTLRKKAQTSKVVRKGTSISRPISTTRKTTGNFIGKTEFRNTVAGTDQILFSSENPRRLSMTAPQEFRNTAASVTDQIRLPSQTPPFSSSENTRRLSMTAPQESTSLFALSSNYASPPSQSHRRSPVSQQDTSTHLPPQEYDEVEEENEMYSGYNSFLAKRTGQHPEEFKEDVDFEEYNEFYTEQSGKLLSASRTERQSSEDFNLLGNDGIPIETHSSDADYHISSTKEDQMHLSSPTSRRSSSTKKLKQLSAIHSTPVDSIKKARLSATPIDLGTSFNSGSHKENPMPTSLTTPPNHRTFTVSEKTNSASPMVRKSHSCSAVLPTSAWTSPSYNNSKTNSTSPKKIPKEVWDEDFSMNIEEDQVTTSRQKASHHETYSPISKHNESPEETELRIVREHLNQQVSLLKKAEDEKNQYKEQIRQYEEKQLENERHQEITEPTEETELRIVREHLNQQVSLLNKAEEEKKQYEKQIRQYEEKLSNEHHKETMEPTELRALEHSIDRQNKIDLQITMGDISSRLELVLKQQTQMMMSLEEGRRSREDNYQAIADIKNTLDEISIRVGILEESQHVLGEDYSRLKEELENQRAFSDENEIEINLSDWPKVLGHVSVGNTRAAYSCVLDSKDTLYLLRLMQETGPDALTELTDDLISDLFFQISPLLTDFKHFELLFPWFESILELGAAPGPYARTVIQVLKEIAITPTSYGIQAGALLHALKEKWKSWKI